MAHNESVPPLALPARNIPVPNSVSPAAQAMLAAGRYGSLELPAPGDTDAWRVRAGVMELAVLSMIREARANVTVAATADLVEIDGARVVVATPHDLSADDRAVFLDMHGGGLYMGGGEMCRAFAIDLAARIKARVWSIDYRLPPDHPYPAALDDCLAAYRALLRERRPQEIIVGGNSAGGNLAAAMILRARDEGLPLPAAAVLHTPEVDLTESGDSFQTHLGLDNVLTGSLMRANLLYAAGHDLEHPYLSPLFGDFTRGFPPTLLATGTRDLFLSNTVRMHRALRAASVPAELHVLEAAPHGGFPGTPEGADLDREIRSFVDAHWQRSADRSNAR